MPSCRHLSPRCPRALPGAHGVSQGRHSFLKAQLRGLGGEGQLTLGILFPFKGTAASCSHCWEAFLVCP